MKKSIKLLSLFIMALVAIFIGKETVFASDNSPATFKASTYDMNPKPLGLTQNISIKKTTSGKYVYCLDVNKSLPTTNITYTRANLITDPAVSYIIASGYNDKNDSEFYATQAALWVWLYDIGAMQDTEKDYIQDIKDAIYSAKYENDPIAKDIKNILYNAALATKPSNAKPTFEFGTDNVKFTLQNGYYTSEFISVKTSLGNENYTIELTGQPTGSKVTKYNGGFIITIPETSVKVGTTKFNVSMRQDTTLYNVYKYTSSNSNYQDMLSVYPVTVSLVDGMSLFVMKEAPKVDDPTTILISKKDTVTGNELAGATLIVKNSNGQEVERWVSTNTPKKFENLAVGTYTLEEIYAPNGYKLSSEKITFVVKNDNKTVTIAMYNRPQNPTTILISKQDITNSKELPGATLIIRDISGREIHRWESTNTPKRFENLPVGTYTLEEIVAPNGYNLSSERITFTVKNDGKINTVVMYNSKKELDKTVILISKQDITNKEELPGATLIVRDAFGNELHRWVSTNTPKKITNLPIGTYTLEEITAPDGYKLSSEKITFAVKQDGKIETVVMYNDPQDPTTILISKKDITNSSELSGATLIIRDANGNELHRWVSTNEPKKIEKLAVGTYTLEEITAPDGYELSSEKITFTVKNDGKIETVVMYNTPKKVEEIIVKISKQDIATKQELPGATLVIRDNNGVEKYRWVSGDTPYIIKGIQEGTYTLEEITAPNGYKLSSEKITFEVKNNGVVTEVVMFNTPESTIIVDVPPTGINASTIGYILGGLVIIIGSVLVYKNVKKEQ